MTTTYWAPISGTRPRIDNGMDGSHVQCCRCGIIRKKRSHQTNTTNYHCRDCSPYRTDTN